VKQGCPLSPLLFSLYINDIGKIAEGVQGAVTGTEDVQVTHMLYADDLTLLANALDALQSMLNRLVVYARSKHLTINTAKSEVVHFNSKRSAQVPTFILAGAALKCSDSSKYLGMTYHRTLNMTASSEHAAKPMLAAAHRICGFVWDTALCDIPFASLWLAKVYVVPAGMYGCQVWSSGILCEGDVFRPTLQTLHMNFLKGTLGVNRSAPKWAVLRECAHEPLQFYWIRAAIRFYNGMLSSNIATLKQALHADLKLVPRVLTSWASDILRAFEGLQGCDTYTQAFLQGLPICYLDFTADLRYRMRKVWRDMADMNPLVLHLLEVGKTISLFFTLFVCSLRRKYSFLFFPFCQSFSMEAPYIPHALPSQPVFDFFLTAIDSAISFRTLWTFFGWRRPATNQSA